MKRTGCEDYVAVHDLKAPAAGDDFKELLEALRIGVDNAKRARALEVVQEMKRLAPGAPGWSPKK